jgi:hypothetical protein
VVNPDRTASTKIDMLVGCFHGWIRKEIGLILSLEMTVPT